MVSNQKSKVAETTELYETANELLQEREAAHKEHDDAMKERYAEAVKSATNARRRAVNWEKRMNDTIARMPPMPPQA